MSYRRFCRANHWSEAIDAVRLASFLRFFLVLPGFLTLLLNNVTSFISSSNSCEREASKSNQTANVHRRWQLAGLPEVTTARVARNPAFCIWG